MRSTTTIKIEPKRKRRRFIVELIAYFVCMALLFAWCFERAIDVRDTIGAIMMLVATVGATVCLFMVLMHRNPEK